MVIVDGLGELERMFGVDDSEIADRDGIPPRLPRVMRDAVSPGFGVLV